MTDFNIAAAIDHRVNDEIHDCIRPGCDGRARVAYYINTPMRIAGRDLMPGEFVDLCPGDDRDLTRAAGEAMDLGFGTRFDGLARMLATDGTGNEQNPLDRFREWTS